jgi:asparagine synthase (glutamine-hydrolysing)
MCRISGIISSNSFSLEQDINRMTDAMRRGGPDDDGSYIDKINGVALGHRRLSILDLSSSGHQPMLDNQERYVIVFNGEIYNYVQLKSELISKGYLFKSNSDTEVILNGYIEWGSKQLLKRLDGMFAFIIYDKVNRTIIGARDHLGIKPLYYSFVGGVLYFSSEVKAFKALKPSWQENVDWHVWFLSFGFIPEPHTTLKNVFHLPAGSFIEYNLKNWNYKITTYYNFNFEIKSISTKDAIAKTKNLVSNAVSNHLLSDVPVGVFLSGGLDSSILTTLAQANHVSKSQQIKTLSIYFEEDNYSEYNYQKIIQARTGVEHHTYKISEEIYQSEFATILEAFDQPSVDGVNTYFISKYARELGLKVALSGLGADELFGGYNSFSLRNDKLKKLKLINLYSKITNRYPEKKFSFCRSDHWLNSYMLNRGLFIASDVAKITGFSEVEVNNILDSYKEPLNFRDLHPLNKVSFVETSIYMKNQLLRDCDYMSMWHGLEIRVPFLDKSIVNFTQSVPPDVKFVKNKKKYLLVEAFKNEIPREIWDRPKQGFGFPFENWVSSNRYLNNQNLVPIFWQRSFKGGKINFNRLFSVLLNNIYFSQAESEFNVISNSQNNLFVYLSASSSVGGIQKVNLNILRALKLFEMSSKKFKALSLHDKFVDSFFFNKWRFKGFNGNKLSFLYHLLNCEIPRNNIIIGHINLLPIIVIFKLRRSKAKYTLITHGIEVWGKGGIIIRLLMKYVDEFISVSEYTKNQLAKNYCVNEEKIIVLKNCLSPDFTFPHDFNAPKYLVDRYNINDRKVVFLLSRISKEDRYKGYLNVIEAISKIKSDIPNIVFLIGGKTEESELTFIKRKIVKLNLEDYVKIIGYVEENEVIDHYLLSNVFAMPSIKEGFGIGFIEAAAAGISVIAGNEDGSKEALLNGELGRLINPNDVTQLTLEIKNAILNGVDKKKLQNKVFENYSFNVYLSGLERILNAKNDV